MELMTINESDWTLQLVHDKYMYVLLKEQAYDLYFISICLLNEKKNT